MIPPGPFFFLNTAFALQDLLCLHVNCEIFCSSSVKNAIGNLGLSYIKGAYNSYIKRASLVAQIVKSPPAVQETWVQFLGQENPLEKGMATLSSILAWKIPWTEEPGGPQSMGSQRVGRD